MPVPPPPYDIAEIMGGLYGPGIIARRGAFERGWVARLREDVDTLFDEARCIPGGAVPRGPNRHYVEIHPERLRGFVDLMMHPWITTVARAVLGPGWRVVEVGFDVPGPGAMDQPWHRDFPMPEATRVGRRLDSLAFNLTTIDVTEDMGPFEIAPGTQWETGEDFAAGMFPPEANGPRYAARAERKLARMGDVSARSALTIHRGTANRSQLSRPVLVLGVDAPDARNGERHDLQLTRRYVATLPPGVLDHLACRLVDELEPIVQLHQIDGLTMGRA
ncbi:phytanoyl-CoA dioxygenase [Lysobacter xinjiangensis]|uniref:Phytanoyl-CoA dioxygenase n=1 Tax=Cognatilysobacter xinjiangensis TaxID=546892 RepID=A0ABQ3C358_9GAMM|nr:phytanoyl-CoA dioxygenase family protein [Lysobacter xinjiangensis]GGZ66069.1 phytanoyl-CoA dioxygenase [Lysobacter xinjiangensis]